MTLQNEFSQFFLTKVNPNNGNETKSDIFPCGILKFLHRFFIGPKIPKHFNDFIIGFFQFHCKSEKKIHNQEQRSLSYSGHHENISIILLQKCFKNICFVLSSKMMLYYLKCHFKQ